MKYNLNQSYHSIYASERKHTTLKYVISSALFLVIGYIYCLIVMFIIGKLFYGMF